MAEEHFVDVIGFGERIDITPALREAIKRCPYKHDFTLAELAELVAREVRGKYIPVATLDRIEGRNLWSITGWVIKRIQSEYRIPQLTDPDLRRLRPYIELVPGIHHCEAANAYWGRWLQPEELTLLPLAECDCDRCDCQYHTQGRRDVEERGAVPRGPN
ncbi:hypothetical protein ACFOM8_06005 [Paracoccus angustae]|uniref:Uncharacterized protein n=1 Tax=Paracoccus angustae TaxID=1671480 RepID=A0ABV7U2B4_9RHOB